MYPVLLASSDLTKANFMTSCYCANIILCVLEDFTPSPMTTKIKCQHFAQQSCSVKAEVTCLDYDCMSFPERNGYPMACLNLHKCVVCVMFTRVQSDKLPEF